MMDRARADTAAIRPTFIDDYLNVHGAHGYVDVKTGAWNTGWHNGSDFTQWTGSQAQRDALRRIWEISEALHAARRQAEESNNHLPALRQELENGFWRLLRAETSCNLFWGEVWVARVHADLDQANSHLARARELTY